MLRIHQQAEAVTWDRVTDERRDGRGKLSQVSLRQNPQQALLPRRRASPAANMQRRFSCCGNSAASTNQETVFGANISLIC